VNASIDFLRKKKRIFSFKEEIVSGSIEKGNGREEKDEEKDILKEAISKLPLRQKNVIILKHFKGLKISEISKILNCSQGSVKIHLFRGIKNLRKILKEDYGKEMY
jgi:RNA polymerase sigma-70 factor (ECF subfamily)